MSDERSDAVILPEAPRWTCPCGGQTYELIQDNGEWCVYCLACHSHHRNARMVVLTLNYTDEAARTSH